MNSLQYTQTCLRSL